MLDGFKLTSDFVQMVDEISNWEEAIIKSATPLLKEGFIEQSYVDAMIDSVKEFGPYIVIAPNIAMPHARPEKGANKAGFSLMKLEKPVYFSEQEEHKAQLLITLACADSNTHIEMIEFIVTVLSDEEKYNAVLEAKTIDEILNIFM
jgi:PTS system ascorbate-specific IIA component